MPRAARGPSASGVYHIMWRGNDRMQIFFDDADRINFLHILDFCANENFIVLAYCLMGNHLHLLIRAGDAPFALETTMKAIGVRYVSYFNRRFQRTGSLFQGRYKSQPVETVGYFLRVLRYIHNNPVAAGLAATMADYPWSSYLDYFGARKTVLCPVDTHYAFSLRNPEQLCAWHERAETNPRGMLEDSRPAAPADAEVRALIHTVAGMESHELHLYPASVTQPVFRRLVGEEGLRIVQLARVTGISRGEIRRLLT